MRLLTCEQCPENKANHDWRVGIKECPIKEKVRAALVGNHIQWTSVQFNCKRIKKNLHPGLVVWVQIAIDREVMEDPVFGGYKATIMEWRGRKVRVWLHEPDDLIKSKWDSIKVWPKQISGWETDRVFEKLCPLCKRPICRKRTRLPDHLNPDNRPQIIFCECEHERRSTS